MTSARVRWVMGSSLLIGCGPGPLPGIEGFSDGFADEIGDTGTGDGDSESDSGSESESGDGDGECPNVDLGGESTPFVIDDSLDASQPSAVGSLCAPLDNTSERTVLWVAPESGEVLAELFTFEAEAWGTVLEGDCGGTPIACVNSGEGAGFFANAGQSYTFVVEGDQSTSYQWFISPNQVSQSCPVGQLFGPSSAVFGATFSASDEFGSNCGGGGSSDQAWVFFPEVSGTYRFDTAGSNFDTVLEVFGDFCGGPFLTCIDDNEFNTQAVLDVDLVAGQPYTIVVDGYGGQSGDYQLSLELLGSSSSLCDGAEFLPSTLPTSLAWPVEVDVGDAFGGCSFFAFERRLIWTAPVDAMVRIGQAAAPNGSALSVFPQGCAEGGFECQVSAPNAEPEVTLPVFAGQELLIVSEYDPGVPGEVVLTIEEVAALPGCGTAMPAGVPSQTSGTTNGSGDEFTGTCGPNPAPEREFWWTAPATGIYTISTAGSNYDTVLYVHDGGCNGVELACNDDWGDLSSQVQVDLDVGQTISIFVDGFSGPGSFDLLISEG